MASLSIAFPIQPDNFDRTRRWGQQKMGPRYGDLTESNRHMGLTRESWHLRQLPNGGAVVILSCEGPDLAAGRSGPMPRRTVRTSAGNGRRLRDSRGWTSGVGREIGGTGAA